MDLPDLLWVRTRRDQPVVDDVSAVVRHALGGIDLPQIRPGQSVAVAVGSRGIADHVSVVAATVAELRARGLDPFVVAAMGSHGGGTADGQRAILARSGIEEDTVGCPVRTGTDVVELGVASAGFPILFDADAAGADHVVVVNRIKPHTMFTGPIESGLAKMLLIGLGNPAGAAQYHRAIVDHTWAAILTDVVPRILARTSVLAGVAVIENAADRTAHIAAVPGTAILDREPELLDRARALLPRLPVDELDVVLIDRIGKDISGTGWDPTVLGRKGSLHRADPAQTPRVTTIAVRSLSDATAGNAVGLGLAELCRTQAVDAMDPASTWQNALTSGNFPAAMVPMHFPTDRELLAACAARTGLRSGADVRLAWIRDTLDLDVVAVSASLAPELADRSDLDVLGRPVPLPLDADGNLPDVLPATPPTSAL